MTVYIYKGKKRKKQKKKKRKKTAHSARPLGREALCGRTVRTPLAATLPGDMINVNVVIYLEVGR